MGNHDTRPVASGTYVRHGRCSTLEVMRRLPGMLPLLLVLAACGSDSKVGPDAAGAIDAPPADAYVDRAGPFFDPEHVVEVSIAMAAGDWDTLRGQTRTLASVLEGDCLAHPAPSPFSDFHAQVTIDGTSFPDVVIHKKGFLGSLDPVKPSLKIDLDDFVAGTRYLGLEKITLNNSRQDPSYMRTCLAYKAFRDAGIAAPRCNFAHVRVNGTDLGVYVNVESVDHKFTAAHFADGTGELFEGTLSDLRTGWLGTYDVKGDGDMAVLQPLATALETASDANLMTALAPYIDVDQFLTYWAMEIILNHWDGYANDRNNYFIYNDPTSGKLVFIPWGPDATFQPSATFGGIGNQTGPVAIAAAGILTNRLFLAPQTRQLILDRERQLLANLYDEAKLGAEVTRMETLITPIADAVQGTGWHANIAGVRNFITNRRQRLTTALDAGPTWTQPLAGYPCLDIQAHVEGTFSTTYGTNNAANPFTTGSGTFQLTMGGQTVALTPVGATAGTDAAGQAVVKIFGQRASDGHIIVVSMSVPTSRFFPRAIDIGFFDGNGGVFDFNPTTMMATQVGTMLGSMTLTQGSTTAGAMVSGSFSGNADVQGSPP